MPISAETWLLMSAVTLGFATHLQLRKRRTSVIGDGLIEHLELSQ